MDGFAPAHLLFLGLSGDAAIPDFSAGHRCGFGLLLLFGINSGIHSDLVLGMRLRCLADIAI